MVARRVAEAVEMMEGHVIQGDPHGTFEGATLDSRQVRGGELFFALPGERTDGHRFVTAALAAGAAAVVVEGRYLAAHPEAVESWAEEGGGTGAVVRVEDALEALHALTRGVRRQVPEKLVGITGSAGKTTTKELLAAVLAVRFRVAKSPGNLNNLLGFPLALLGIPDDTQWMVAEMGMSEPGELGRISRLARPDVAVFTNVRPAHLEFFGSLEAIAEAKAELLEGLPASGAGGLVVANADDPLVRRIAQRHHGRTVYYGLGREPSNPVVPEATALDVRSAPPGEIGSRFTLHIAGEGCPVTLPLHGLYNVENFLAAAATGWALGLTVEEIARGAQSLRGAAGRGEVRAITRAEGRLVVIDDSYNSNPDAAQRALESAAAFPLENAEGRRWAVLGDMLELGPEGSAFHRRVGAAAARWDFSPVVGVGVLARDLTEAAAEAGAETHWFATAAEAAAWLPGRLRDGDLLLVKGSRGVGLDAVVAALAGSADAGGVP